jgi:hypothetical protein
MSATLEPCDHCDLTANVEEYGYPTGCEICDEMDDHGVIPKLCADCREAADLGGLETEHHDA